MLLSSLDSNYMLRMFFPTVDEEAEDGLFQLRDPDVYE